MHSRNLTEIDEQAARAPENVLARFYARVRVTNTCHLFEPPNKTRYGAFTISRGFTMSAHRFALIRAVGAPNQKKKLQACHYCLTKNCVRPSHLYWGTAKQNAADKKRDGTDNSPKGPTHFRSKINEDIARQFVKMYKVGKYSLADIANKYGVSQTCVGMVLRGITWRDATEGLRVPLKDVTQRAIKKGDSHAYAKLTVKDIPTIRRRWAEGVGSQIMAKEYGVAPRTIRDAANCLTWKHIP